MPGDHRRRMRAERLPTLTVRSLFCRTGFATASLAACIAAAAPADPPALTERRAMELALSRPAYRELEQGHLATAESAVMEADLLPNPVLAMERERVNAAGGRSTESSVQVSQTFDFSGRRALRREAAGNRLDAARFDQQERRLATISEVRRAFGEALHRERVRAALSAWVQRIDAIASTVARLAKAGEASGYDRRRLERESRTAQARAAGAAADSARKRAALAGLIDESAEQTPVLAGELLPAAPAPLELAQAALRERPDLASRLAQAEAFDRERGAAERAWIPDVTLALGHKRIDEANRTDNGMIVGFSLPIPLFERGQAGQQRARAQAITLRAEHALALAKSVAELRGVWREAAELRRAAETLRRESLVSSRELIRIAEAAYRAGEGGILELLDAYKAELEAETTVLDLELRARLARIELDTLSGAKSHE